MAKVFWALAFWMVAIALPGQSAPREISFDVYGDWRVVVLQVDSNQETWRECTASTGGDGDPTLKIRARQYDGGPPDVYLPIEFREQAPRHYDTLMQDAGLVTFTFNDGQSFHGRARTGIAEGAFKYATASPTPEMSLPVLQAMRRAEWLEISYEGTPYYSASLAGFTAAYGKIAEACEFSTVGVITPLPDATGYGETTGDPGDNDVLLFEEFGVWRAQAEEFESDGAVIRECFASIAADTARRLSFGINSLEAAPPSSFPPLILSEAIVETAAPMVSTGSRVQFAFDTGLILPGEVITDIASDGTRFIDAAVIPGYRDMALREMRRATNLWVYGDGAVIYQTPLNGFLQAYAAIAETCAFTTAGVLD